jgi:Monogalactosyldiacylglycerol (MGDG) synthase
LVVTSSGSPPSAVVPVLAALEAAGMRVRAIDVGGAGGGGGAITDRVRRALLGEGAERKLKRELEQSPPDATVVFDPHAALALTVARDQATNPAPVVAVVAELEPAPAWAQTDADRFIAVDELAAVALADAGVEGDRILVVGAIGERAFADAGAQDRMGVRSRFKLSGKLALVEVAGLGAEITGQLALQLSLLDANESITFLFDAAGDVDAAAVLRRQVPTLGLRGKLFGVSADAPLLWRAADVIVARPRPETVARLLLVGGKLVALIDDQVPGGAKLATALEARKRAISARGLLMLASAMDSAFGGTPPHVTDDGADHVADIVAAVAGDKRGVIDERRAAAYGATRDRVRAASAAAQSAAATTAMPGELEDLGGAGGNDSAADASSIPDKAELERLRSEVARRVAEMSRSMAAARDAATELADKAKGATARGAADEAAQLDRKADAERARMHSMLAELANLESELKELERAIEKVKDMPSPPRASASTSSSPASDRVNPGPRISIEDQLAALKKSGGGTPPPRASSSGPAPKPTNSSPPPKRTQANVDDDLAALKKKMAAAPPKKK